jgi:hypothetical protein
MVSYTAHMDLWSNAPDENAQKSLGLARGIFTFPWITYDALC